MEEYVAALTWRTAPGKQTAKWHQQSMKRVFDRWEQSHSDDLDLIFNSQDFTGAAGFHLTPTEIGQYGYGKRLQFKQDSIDESFGEFDTSHLVKPFYDDWMVALQEVIQEDQEATLFSPKEYAAFFTYRHPRWHEPRAADALDITVGTYRGKVGRIKSKIESARATVELDESCSEEKPPEFWRQDSHRAALSVIHRVEESRLPINSLTLARNEHIDIDNLPLDKLMNK